MAIPAQVSPKKAAQAGYSHAPLPGRQGPPPAAHMANMMPYHYPPAPSHPDVGMGMSSAYMPGYGPASGDPMELKKPASLPDMRQDGGSRKGSTAGGSEKKRNKLNYCRTSKACKYCRHRKIRCLTDPADSQGRCVNCIRLKRECTKQPVDHDTPTSSSSTAASSTTATSSSSAAGPRRASTATRSATGSSAHQQQIESGESSPVLPPGPTPTGDGPGHPYMRLSTLPTGPLAALTPMPLQSPGETNTPVSERDMAGPQVGWRQYSQESPVATPGFSPYAPAAPTGWQQAPPPPPLAREPPGMRHHSDAWSPYAPVTTAAAPGAAGGGHYSHDRRPSMPDPHHPHMYPLDPHNPHHPMDQQQHHAPLSAGAVPPSAYGAWPPAPAAAYHHYQAAPRHDGGYGGWGAAADPHGHAEAHHPGHHAPHEVVGGEPPLYYDAR